MSTLAQRLQKVQQSSPVQEFDFSHLSMDQLETSTIKFGKTHVGKTFNHMWTQEQGWVLWFTQRFSQSSKYDHQMFLFYVDKKVERCELTGIAMPTASTAEHAKARAQSGVAKASAKAKTTQAPLVQGAPEGIPQSVWDEEDPDLFEMLPEIEPIMPVNQVEQLENRISTMESALNRIINYIEQNTTTLIAEQ